MITSPQTRFRTLAALLAMFAMFVALLGLPDPAQAQAAGDDNPTLEVVNDAKFEHLDVVRMKGSGFAPGAIIRVSQCASADASGCKYLGGFGPNALGDFLVGVAVYREMFVDGARTDCAAVDCVLQASSGTSSFGFDLRFNDRYPMPAIDVSPNVGISPGDEITVTANDFKPQKGDEQTPVWLCPTAGYNQAACEEVAMIDPGQTAVFAAPRMIVSAYQAIDCAEAPGSCFLRIGAFEARWSVSYNELQALPDATVEFGKVRKLADGDLVTIKVNSPWEDLLVYQCVRKGGCTQVVVTQQARVDGAVYIDQTITVPVQRYPAIYGQQFDCAAAETRCQLKVRGGSGAVKLDAKNIKFTGDEPQLKKAKIKLPTGDFEAGERIRIKIRNLPEAETFRVFQCDADLVHCQGRKSGDVRKPNFGVNLKLRPSVRHNLGEADIDCTESAGACALVLVTNPSTVRLVAPLTIG